MRSTTNQDALNQLALIIAKLRQAMQDVIEPNLSPYLNAVEFDIKKPQRILANFLDSHEYASMLSLINDNLGPVVCHDDTSEDIPNDNKIHVYLEKDASALPVKFMIMPFEKLNVYFALNDIEKESCTIKDRACTYVDYRDAICKSQQEIELLIADVSFYKHGKTINDNLRDIVRLIMQFNSRWGDFIPMSFELIKIKSTEARIKLQWRERFETSKLFSTYSELCKLVPFIEEGIYKDLLKLKVSPGRDCEITTTCRIENKSDDSANIDKLILKNRF